MSHRWTLILLAGALIAIVPGCGGDAGVAPRSTTADTAPPATPSGLAAGAAKRVVKLAWDANTTDADLQGYLVYRLAFGQAYLLTPDPIEGLGFIDRSPLRGECIYAVAAVDLAGNESAWTRLRFRPPHVESRASDAP